MPVIKRYGRNMLGRDFVVGDLHGCYDHLATQLRLIGFDTSADRLFSVGDLIDRGPKSLDVLRLLREPWFHAVKGNHEELMVDAVRTQVRTARDVWIRNGGAWAYDPNLNPDPEEFEALVCLAADLPLGIIVEAQDGRLVGICHAESPEDGEWTEESFAASDSVLWGRQRISGHRDLPDVVGVDETIHGHTPGKIMRHGKEKWIDAGCFYTGKLIVLEI